MKLLLDTHTFIWWDSDPAKLSATAMALCSDPGNELILSATSLWEMQIKHQLGKLSLRLPLVDIVTHQLLGPIPFVSLGSAIHLMAYN